jgi:hypothetical protein
MFLAQSFAPDRFPLYISFRVQFLAVHACQGLRPKTSPQTLKLALVFR